MMDRRFGLNYADGNTDEDITNIEDGGMNNNAEDLCAFVREQLAENEPEFNGPFGRRRVLYCDYTASGRSLRCIEQHILDQVQPFYANTHSSASVTAEQTTLYLHEARSVLRNAVRASEHDAVLYTGTSCTDAVGTLLHALDWDTKPLVIVGPHEHHTNLLPWRERAEQVLTVRETDDGSIDITDLERLLKSHSTESDRPIIGCFAAASNVTGVLADVDDVTCLLHKYKALSFWDYATAAPYVPLEMNPAHCSAAAKDAVYFSGHKFLGGVGSPGVLIAKKSLFRNQTPQKPGGGTVFFVDPSNHSYLREIEYREEGGTPDVIGAVRLALAYRIKLAVGTDAIHDLEVRNVRHFLSSINSLPGHDNITFLGPAPFQRDRLPVFSFVVKDPSSGLLLHHSVVTTLLNDLFGIQTRSGCMCAGPYAQHLLGIDAKLAGIYESMLKEHSQLDRSHLRRVGEYSDYEMLRPGFTRLSLPYFVSRDQIEFIAKALVFVATHGWRFLPLYVLNRESGEWHHREQRVFTDRKWLHNWTFTSNGLQRVSGHNKEKQTLDDTLLTDDACLHKAKQLCDQMPKLARRYKSTDDALLSDPQFLKYRWFLLSSEAAQRQIGKRLNDTSYPDYPMPFTPRSYVPGPAEWLILPDADFVVKNDPRRAASNEKRITKLHLVHEDMINVHDHDNDRHNDDSHYEYQYDTDDGNDNDDKDNVNNINVNNDNVNDNDNDNNNDNVNDNDNNDNDTNTSTVVIQPRAGTSMQTNDQCSIQHQLPDSSSSSVCRPCVMAVASTSKGSSCCTTTTNGTSIKDSWNDRTVVKRDATLTERNLKYKWHCPPKEILKHTLNALNDFDCIREGDRVLVCLSGGKDSLSLLHTMRHIQRMYSKTGPAFQLGAITIDPQSSSYDPSPLIEYLTGLNLDYLYERQDIVGKAAALGTDCRSICAFCSRMKRGRLYASARAHGYNVLAFGQHLDDLAESFLMSTFQNGILRTMKAHYTIQDQDLRIIRPLVYVREKQLRDFAESRKLPVIPENCPACFEQPKERHRIKQMLASQELHSHVLFNSMRSALKPLMAVTSPVTELFNQQVTLNIQQQQHNGADEED